MFFLTWLAPEETGSGGAISGYNIWRHDGNDWRQIVTNTNDAERRYVDGETTLVEGRTYSYAIRAINPAGPGKWSQVTSAIINPQVPSAPRRFQADAQTSGVVMSWLEPADSGTGGAVSGYNIWRKGSGVWREIVVDTDSTSTSYTDTDEDLITGAQYSFSIRAINNAGHGEWSAVIPVIINPNFPSAPRRLTAIKIGQGITLTWLAPADNGFGGPVTGYTIWRNDGSGWRELVSNTGDTNRSYNDTSATGTNITYWYTVRAINAAGPGEWSETAIWSDVDIELEEQRTSSVPRRLEVDAQSSGVVMTWLAPAIPGSAGAVTGYNIWRKKSGGNWGAIVSNTNSGVTNYLDTDENLEDGKRYWYAVRAINAGGYSEWSETASAIINPQVPSAPRRLFVDAQSNWCGDETGLLQLTPDLAAQL